MFTSAERAEIISLGQEDGQRIFVVCTAIYKGLIILNYIIGVLGGLLGVGLLIATMAVNHGGGMCALIGLGVLVATTVFCAFNYVVAVLSTHVSKVLVHILFANLAIMDRGEA